MKRLFSFLLAVGIFAGLAHCAAASDSPAFKNGPYLLAPKPHSMVVAWESTSADDASVAFGTEKDALGAPITVSRDKNAPEFQGAQMNMYHYKLDNLKPGTRYYYTVTLPGGEVCKASFKTLAENPDEVNLLTVSDTHVFSTRSKFNDAVKKFDPDFILHTGDMLEGTGAQVEQFGFWFKGIADDDFIHSYPAVYVSGNHDYGGPYANAYIYDVQDAEYGAEVTGNVTFTHGNIKIVAVDSNPWALFQMNSETAGNPADPATMVTIDKTKNWLRKVLDSDEAKNAEFRLVYMHHPQSDTYTKRHIPEILEAGNVDLMLAGHTHSYARNVSDNPAVGASTTYLTHQDARIHSPKGDFFHVHTVPGKGTLQVDVYGTDSAEKDSKQFASTTISRAKQQLAFSEVSITPDEVLFNGDVTISAKVTNAGNGLAAAAIPVVDNGETRYLYKFGNAIKTLEPGASATLTGTLRMESLGSHVLKLGDQTASVNVLFRPATFDYANVRVKLGDGETSDLASNKLNIKADINNIGNEDGVAKANFVINGKPVASKTYKLASGETKTAEFTYDFDRAGDYFVTIGDAPDQNVYIEGSIQGMPIVKDKSGNGNFAYIHGAPRLGLDDRGRQSLILDGRRDYVEIPDNGGYTVDNAMSGMVWANLPGEGTTKGGVTELVEPYIDLDGKGSIPDHNPLLLKGISIGWGTPYLFRIAVRETGKITYGVCLYDDNGEYQWNDGSQDEAGIKKDTWVQYSSTFSFAEGGDGYQNGYHSAHVAKPAFTAAVKNWEGAPMYIGLGFKNTLLPGRNRGMYHTMLPGAVSQLRFYTKKISAEENDSIRNSPTEAGASAKDLKIWLDFENENIETRGSHTTEWVDSSSAPTSLAYNAAFSGGAAMTASVQTSDNAKDIKQEEFIPLSSGRHTVELSGLSPAKYVRIHTVFDSDLNMAQSSVPVLNEYVLTAGEVKRWNTLADWQKGTFEGAAGHQSEDVYRNHAKDFDNYSGTSHQPDEVEVLETVVIP